MEIIQPLVGFENLFEYLEKHTEGPFRVTEKMTEEAMDAFKQHMAELGYEAEMSGEINGESFACYNLEAWGGSVYEIAGPAGCLSLDGFKTELWPEN